MGKFRVTTVKSGKFSEFLFDNKEAAESFKRSMQVVFIAADNGDSISDVETVGKKYSKYGAKCKTIAQRKAFDHIEENFTTDGITSLKAISGGIRLTDCTGAVADFIYNSKTDTVNLKQEV